MKRKTTVLALVLAFVMSFGSLSVFAAVGPPTEGTKQAIKDAKVQSQPTIKDEVSAERFAMDLAEQTQEGGYKLVDTATLKSMQDVVIVDTMPASWFAGRHLPGAVNAVVGAMNGPKFVILPGEEKALLQVIKDKVGTKKYYWNSKKKAWVTKKPKKKYWKKCNKKGDPFKGKKTKNDINKEAKIVVYCGFVKCQRSHQGAMFLVKQGFKNVYRYPGGISAWVDANNNVEGSDIK